LAQNNKDNGVTLNKFFSVGMGDDDFVANFDDRIYDVIVFDEIYFAGIHMFSKIKQYSESNLDQKILSLEVILIS